MLERIRAVTWKNVIIAVSLIVISLAVSLHFSDEVFAAGLLPAVSAEEGTEDTLQEQTPQLNLPDNRNVRKRCSDWRRMSGAGDASTQSSFLSLEQRRSRTGSYLKARTIMYLASTPRIHAYRSPGQRAGWMQVFRPGSMKRSGS